jgi:hypothetical protein
MSGIVMFAKSRRSPVWLRQRCGKAPPAVAPDLILQCGHLASPGLRAAGIVSANPQNSAIPAAAELFSFPQDSANHSMPIGAGVVWRFSPIHF